MAYDILELPEIPRDRAKLKAIIGEARYRRRKSRIIQFISYGLIAVAVLILGLGSCSYAPAASTGVEAIYLPIISE